MRGDEGFQQGVFFDVARGVEAVPLAVEGMEDFGILDGETDGGGDGIHAVLEGIVPDGVFALRGFGASAFLGIGPIGRAFAVRDWSFHGPG